MLEQKEYKGYFYLPETPDKRISGVLYFHPNEAIRLELFNDCISESEKQSSSFFRMHEIKTIFGVVKTENNAIEPVTISDC